jgi:hypothetical protein
MHILGANFTRLCSVSASCGIVSVIIWTLWSRSDVGRDFGAPVLWLVMVALGMLTAWRAMLHGTNYKQDWMSGGLFMFHVLSFLLLLFNLTTIGGRE